MSKKGSSTVENYERELSPQELRLFETQNDQMQQAIDIYGKQENRSEEQYTDWKRAYLPAETGMISQGATRANGYQGGVQGDGRSQLFQGQIDNQMPRYREDTSGVYNAAPMPNPQGGQAKGSGAQQGTRRAK